MTPFLNAFLFFSTYLVIAENCGEALEHLRGYLCAAPVPVKDRIKGEAYSLKQWVSEALQGEHPNTITANDVSDFLVRLPPGHMLEMNLNLIDSDFDRVLEHPEGSTLGAMVGTLILEVETRDLVKRCEEVDFRGYAAALRDDPPT